MKSYLEDVVGDEYYLFGPSIMKISKEKSMIISERGREAIINFDLDRMKRAVDAPYTAVPNMKTTEELLSWFENFASVQETLDSELQEILLNNLWELYEC